jgi:hypothetical protein
VHKGDLKIAFRRTFQPAESTEADLALCVDDASLASVLSLYVVSEGSAPRRLPRLNAKVPLPADAKTTLICVAMSSAVDIPEFDWKLVCLSDAPLAPAPVQAAEGEEEAEPLPAVGKEGCDVVTRLGGKYVPNKYNRFFQDKITATFKGLPLSLRFRCANAWDDMAVKVVVKDMRNGEVVAEGTGRTEVTMLSLAIAKSPPVELGEGEEETPEELVQLVVEATIDSSRTVVPDKYKSHRPYYFQPTAEKAVEEGEEAPAAVRALPSVETAESEVAWYVPSERVVCLVLPRN